jgi:hypothetical protein
LKLKSNTGEEFNLEHPELSLIIRKFLITWYEKCVLVVEVKIVAKRLVNSLKYL